MKFVYVKCSGCNMIQKVSLLDLNKNGVCFNCMQYLYEDDIRK